MKFAKISVREIIDIFIFAKITAHENKCFYSINSEISLNYNILKHILSSFDPVNMAPELFRQLAIL